MFHFLRDLFLHLYKQIDLILKHTIIYRLIFQKDQKIIFPI